MPSLQDTLSILADHSKQISQLSSYNDQPRGPFLDALLHPSVLSLIREAEPKEARLFKFVGEEGGGKRVEKRDGATLTPLRKMKGKEVDNVEVMLRTALRLVDDYGPMPRAKSHIKDLIRAHDQQSDRIAELGELIEEARRPKPKSPRAPRPAKLDIDEIIKAEEEALKVLENSVAAMRDKPRRSPSPERISPASKAPRWSVAQTPGKTPISSRQISNSLVSGQTPRRTTQPSRFSPLKLLTTPKVQKGRKSIFARQAVRVPTGLAYTIPVAPVVAEEEEGVGDETIRIAPAPASPEKSPAPPVTQSGSIDYDSQTVRDGISKIASTMGDMLGQETDAKGVIQHLERLSHSNPDPLPSPSSSVAAPSQLMRITPTTILTAHLLLILLRSPDGTAMNEIKEKLGTVSQGKGWTEGDLGTKVVYQAMGKKCVKIDRRGGNGGKVSFAT